MEASGYQAQSNIGIAIAPMVAPVGIVLLDIDK